MTATHLKDTAISMLEMQHAAAEADFASLTDTLNELLNDLDTKQNSIRIDDACVRLRLINCGLLSCHSL